MRWAGDKTQRIARESDFRSGLCYSSSSLRSKERAIEWSVSVAQNPKQVYPCTWMLWYRGVHTRIRTNGQPGFFFVMSACLEHCWQSSLSTWASMVAPLYPFQRKDLSLTSFAICLFRHGQLLPLLWCCKYLPQLVWIGQGRSMPPNKGQTWIYVVHGDIIKLVNVSFIENNNLHLQDPKVKEFIAAQGVDLVYESAKGQPSIWTKYSRDAEDALVLRVLKLSPANIAITANYTLYKFSFSG